VQKIKEFGKEFILTMIYASLNVLHPFIFHLPVVMCHSSL